MKRAVLMIVDGLRADLITPELTPNLHAIAGRSRVFDRHRSVFPSATRVNAASIATGCYPSAHGLAGNTIALDEGDGLRPVSVGPAEFRERWRRATGRTLARPTLAERLRDRGGVIIYSNSSAGAAHMHDPDGHGHLFHRSGSHRPGLIPIESDPFDRVTYDADGDAFTTGRFCGALEHGGETALFVLWICEPDHSQHAMELGCPAHRAVLARSDARIAEVSRAVDAQRAGGDDVLFLLGSDHGHETVESVIPVTERLVEAGFKTSLESSDVVLASSGMGALLYFAPEAEERRPAVAAWLRAQAWIQVVYAGAELAEIDLPTGTPLGIAFGMAKRDGSNRFGVPGLGYVAADPFSPDDRTGCGQHGGLGPYETRPFLIANGPRESARESAREPARVQTPSVTVDIAPTILEHLGAPLEDTDGRSLLGS